MSVAILAQVGSSLGTGSEARPVYFLPSALRGHQMSGLQEPKKAQTAYFIFFNEKRAEFAKQLGGKAACGPLAKLASERWAVMSSTEREPFEKKAADGKAQYEKALLAFKEAGGDCKIISSTEEPLKKPVKKPAAKKMPVKKHIQKSGDAHPKNR